MGSITSLQKLTLAFWVRSNKTGTYHIGLYNTDNARMNGRTYTIDSANTWELKTISFDADTSQGFTNDNNSSLLIEWWLAGGTDYTSGSTPTAWTSADNTIRAGGLAVNLAWEPQSIHKKATYELDDEQLDNDDVDVDIDLNVVSMRWRMRRRVSANYAC